MPAGSHTVRKEQRHPVPSFRAGRAAFVPSAAGGPACAPPSAKGSAIAAPARRPPAGDGTSVSTSPFCFRRFCLHRQPQMAVVPAVAEVDRQPDRQPDHQPDPGHAVERTPSWRSRPARRESAPAAPAASGRAAERSGLVLRITMIPMHTITNASSVPMLVMWPRLEIGRKPPRRGHEQHERSCCSGYGVWNFGWMSEKTCGSRPSRDME